MDLQQYATAQLKRGYSVRTYVSVAVAIILVPTLIIGGWLAARSADSERALLEQNLQDKAREITADLDREIVIASNMLTALASSQFLQTEDFEAFHRQALDVSRQLNINNIVLRDPNLDEQVINTSTPWGAPRRRGAPQEIYEAEQELLRSGKFIVSNIFYGRLNKQHIITVWVPVNRNGVPKYALGVSIPAERFADILRDSDPCADCLATVIDRNNVIIARSQRHDELVGASVTNDVAGVAGVIKGKNRDGIAYHWVWRRSDMTGWFVTVGASESVLNAPFQRALIGYGITSSLLFILTMALSYHFGGRLSRSIGTLGVDRKPTRKEFEILFESAPNGVVVVDGQGLIILLNTQLGKKYGYSREELIGRPVEMLIPERFHSGYSDFMKGSKLNPQARQIGVESDLFGKRKDGSEFPIEICLNPIRTGAGNFVMATVVDVTARKRAVEQLSSSIIERDDLRRRLMQTQEDERLRLAHELHDQTGQSLAAIMLELKGIESFVNEDGRKRMRGLRKQLDRMAKSLHHMAWELRPASIDELGLASALADYVSEWSQQYGIEADFHCRDAKLDGLSEEVRTTIYRVVQEGLTNITKHARGTTVVSVVIDRADAILRLTIEDNGSGFDVATPEIGAGRKGRGLGLAGMRERLSLLGGYFEIESSIDSGTTIFVRIPLERERMTA